MLIGNERNHKSFSDFRRISLIDCLAKCYMAGLIYIAQREVAAIKSLKWCNLFIFGFEENHCQDLCILWDGLCNYSLHTLEHNLYKIHNMKHRDWQNNILDHIEHSFRLASFSNRDNALDNCTPS